MRIHFFVLTLNEMRGGSHHNAMAMIRALREQGHEVTAHAFSSYDNQPPADISLLVHEGGGYGLVKGKTYLKKLLAEYESAADVFFLYGTDFTWGAGEYRMNGKVSVVVYLDTYLSSMGIMHEYTMSRFGHMRYVIKRYLWDKLRGLGYARHVDKFLAVSPYIQDAYIRFGFSRDKFAVIPNFFGLPHNVPEKTPDDTVRILYTGRFTYDKGTDLLLRVVAQLQSKQWRLRMVGDGPQKALCEEFIARHKLGDRVEMVPWTDMMTLSGEYARADIFVHPARWPEPFGRTVVEAMMSGVPVIVPKQGGAAWIAGDAGLTFENGNEQALRAAIERLIADGALRAKLGQKGKERAKVFRKEVVVPELEQMLKTVYNAAV